MQSPLGIRHTIEPGSVMGMPQFAIDRERGDYIGSGPLDHNAAPFLIHGSEWRFKIGDERGSLICDGSLPFIVSHIFRCR